MTHFSPSWLLTAGCRHCIPVARFGFLNKVSEMPSFDFRASVREPKNETATANTGQRLTEASSFYMAPNVLLKFRPVRSNVRAVVNMVSEVLRLSGS